MIYIGIALGGAIGSVLRYAVGMAASNIWNTAFPIGTMLANLIGSLFLGWFTARVVEKKKLSKPLVAAIGIGMTGSFTTFSAFSLETFLLLETGEFGMAIGYILVSSVGGLLLAAAGYRLGDRMEASEGEVV